MAAMETHDPFHLDLDDLPPPPELVRESTSAMEDEEEEQTRPPKNRKRKAATAEPEVDEEEEEEKKPRKARALMEKEEAFEMVDEAGRVVLTPDAKGKYDSYKFRTCVVSLRKKKFIIGDEAQPSELKLLIDDKEVTLPLHGRSAKRKAGLAKANAFDILDKLRQHGVINGRYVSVLRDFGFGGNSANKLVKLYTARGKDLVKVEDDDAPMIEPVD